MDNNSKMLELEFQHFFVANFPKVKNFALMLLKDETEAEDVAQEIFCKLWLQPQIWIGNGRDTDNYLFTLTRNSIFNILKHRKVQTRYMDEAKSLAGDFIDSAGALDDIYYEEKLLAMKVALASMPPKRREIFIMNRFDGLSHKEIADKLGISVRTSEHQVYLALVQLKKLFLALLPIIAILKFD